MISLQEAFEIAQKHRPNEIITMCEEAPDFYIFGSFPRDWDGDENKRHYRASDTVSKIDGKTGYIAFNKYVKLARENRVKKVNVYDYLSPEDAALARKMLSYLKRQA